MYLYVFIYVAFFPFGIQCSQKNTDTLVQATFLLDTIAYFDKCHAFVLKNMFRDVTNYLSYRTQHVLCHSLCVYVAVVSETRDR